MDEDFAKLYLFIGLTGTFSRPAGGLLCQVNRIKALLVFQMSIAILGIMFLLLPVLSSYRLLVIFSLLFGVGDGLLVTSTNVSALKCFKDPVKKTSGYGILMLFTSVAFGVGPPLSGMLLGNAIFRERKVPYNMYQGGHHCMGDTMNRKGVGGPLSGMTLDNPLHGLPLLLTLLSAIYGEGWGPHFQVYSLVVLCLGIGMPPCRGNIAGTYAGGCTGCTCTWKKSSTQKCPKEERKFRPDMSA